MPRGHRIFVLSLQGEALQVFTHPESKAFGSLCCFDGKLLANEQDGMGLTSYLGMGPARHMLALRGL